jgi:hypothetical protein
MKGQEGNIDFKPGEVHYAVNRLINSVWTISFAVVEEGKIYLLEHSRDLEIGYEQEKSLPQFRLKEDDKRIVEGAKILIMKNSWDIESEDYFDIVNKKHVFSYEGAEADVKNYPSLRFLYGKTMGKKFGLSEMKHVQLFEKWLDENAPLYADQKDLSQEMIFRMN